MKFVQIICTLSFLAAKARSQNPQSMEEFDLVNDIFLRTSERVNGTIHELFDQLRLTQSLTKSKLYLKEFKMFNYLQNTESINYKIFKKIGSICKFVFDKKNDYVDLVEEILNDLTKTFIVEFISENANPMIMDVFHSYLPRIRKSNDDENLSLEFIKDFINKIDSLTVNDFISKKNRISEVNLKLENEDEKRKYETKDNSSADLSYWEPHMEIFDEMNNASRRLYGPHVDTPSIKMFPFMASIHIDDEFVCSGCIISINIVISAASCIAKLYKEAERGDSFSNLTIRFGSDYAHKDGNVMKATQVNFHPDFDILSLRHNIALIKVRKADMNRVKWLKRVRYEKNCSRIRNPEEVGKNIKVLGWGARNMNDPQKKIPLSLDKLTLYDLEICQNIYTRLYVTEQNFCAGAIKDGIGACDKDVGGPGLFSGTLVGVVSFGSPECGLPDSPTVFTQVASYSKWIDDVLNENELVVLEGKPQSLREGDQIHQLAQAPPIVPTALSPKARPSPPRPSPTIESTTRKLMKIFRGRWQANEIGHGDSLIHVYTRNNPRYTGQGKMDKTTRRFVNLKYFNNLKSRYINAKKHHEEVL